MRSRLALTLVDDSSVDAAEDAADDAAEDAAVDDAAVDDVVDFLAILTFRGTSEAVDEGAASELSAVDSVEAVERGLGILFLSFVGS